MQDRLMATFFLRWVVVSWLATGAGFVFGLLPAFAAAVIVTFGGNGALSVLSVPVAATLVGATVGVIVGSVQSLLLPWTPEYRHRWIRQSAIGWPLGIGLGVVVATVLAILGVGANTGRGASFTSHYLLEIATPINGLLLGWLLRSAVPGPPVRLAVWLGAHVLAVSGGWIASRMLVGGSFSDTGTLPGFILGVLCYGVVSGLIMCCVVRVRRPEVAASDRVGAV
jgi:hypothetical protein